MEVVTVAGIIVACVSLAGAVGGLLLKAYVSPVKTRTDDNHDTIQDHESRIRGLETKVNIHSVHMENLMKSVDTLVVKIDLLITKRYAGTSDREE